MTLEPPFALFVLSSDVDTEYINYSLRRAWRGNFMAGWEFWVATNNYNDMPRKKSDNQAAQGTAAPISPAFSSQWVGMTVNQCAQWLQNAPSDAAVNREYFTAMNEHSRADDTVLVCRIVKSRKSGGFTVEYFPQPTDVVAMHMSTNGGGKFDEKALHYQHVRRREGKPDRSSSTSN